MKNSYLRVTDSGFRPWLLAVFLWTLFAPKAILAQSFTETMGATVGGTLTPTNHDNAGRFDNSAAFAFRGNTLMSIDVPSPASGSVNVLYPTGSTDNASNFVISNINITAPSLAQTRVSFWLFVPSGAPTSIATLNSYFRLIPAFSNDNGLTYTAGARVSYLPESGGGYSTNQWVKFTAFLDNTDLPDGFTGPASLLELRFSRNNTVSSAAANALAFRLDDVQFAPPTVLVNPTALNFGSQSVNTFSAPRTITVSGDDLTGPVTVTAPAGYELAVGNSTVYASSVQLTPANGDISTSVSVRFRPTSAATFGGSITFVSPGAETREVVVVGTGTAPTPVLSVVASQPINFGSVQVGTASTSQTFQVSGQDLGTTPITVAAPAGFQVRLPSGIFSSQVTLNPINGAVASTTIEARFVPNTVGAVSANITVGATGAPPVNVVVQGNGTPAPAGATITATPTVIDFGPITSSGAADIRSFTLSGTNLTQGITLTPSGQNVLIRNASAGGEFSNNPLVIAPTGGTVSPVTIEVQLLAPPTIPGGNFAGSIALTSPGANAVNVSVTATSNGAVSDISITTTSNFVFATRPNTTSVSQSFTISGANLLQALTVAPSGPNAQYFQVSLDNQSFSSSVVIPVVNGNVTPRLVYVRFIPGAQAITVNGIIRATSSPAPNRDVSVTGISEPAIRLSAPIGDFGDRVVKNTPSAPRTVTVLGFLLSGTLDLRFPSDTEDPGRNPSATPQYEFSLDNGQTYQKTASLATDTDGNITQQLLVRYAPTRVGNATQVMEFRNSALNNNNFFTLTSGNGLVQGFAIAEQPTAQSTATVARNADKATLTFNLSSPPAGTSYGQNRLIIASPTYQQLPSRLFPQDKNNFQPGETVDLAYQYGTGTAIEASTGTFVVFSGAASQVTIGNLDPTREYYFFIFDYNDDNLARAENYITPNNPTQPPLPVSLLSFSARLSGGKVALRWTTAAERNNKGFEVERSADGKTFSTVLFLAGKGTTTARTDYEAADPAPLRGVSYYRLKQIDFDGKVWYSSPAIIRNLGRGELVVYPNPVRDVLTVETSGAAAGQRFVITDMTGRAIRTGVLSNDAKIDVADLQAGTYFLSVGEGNAKATRRIVKQ